MNENLKTLAFVAVAAAVALAAVITRPSLSVSDTNDLSGQLLYLEFTNPLAVTSLEIVEFDEDTATVRPFKVAQVEVKGKTRWVIPSHDDYPADATDQVAAAAAGLMALQILQVVSDKKGDQQEYGVIDPDPNVLRVGATGVGERVVMRDREGKELLALVIGKEAPGPAGLRYVRKVDEDPIYIVKVKTGALSTKFENWIERNLLGINTWDIKRLRIRDYSVDELNRELVQRGEMLIEYNDTGEPRWKLLEDQTFEAGKWAPLQLADHEQLNAAKLNELIGALSDLKIVDVSRKPAGLSADLKAAADFSANRQAIESLARRGFFVAELDGQVELFSNEGEIRITMKDGVEYILRFGEIAAGGAAKKDEEKKSGGSGLNRYLFVMVEFNPDIIPKPQLEPLPEIKKEIEKNPAQEKQDDGKKEADMEAEEAERQRIEKENKRKQEEYDQKIADGKKRVDKLNARFADWYYVISDEVYRKVHLARDEIVKKKAKEKVEGEEKKDADRAVRPSESLQPAPI